MKDCTFQPYVREYVRPKSKQPVALRGLKREFNNDVLDVFGQKTRASSAMTKVDRDFTFKVVSKKIKEQKRKQQRITSIEPKLHTARPTYTEKEKWW